MGLMLSRPVMVAANPGQVGLRWGHFGPPHFGSKVAHLVSPPLARLNRMGWLESYEEHHRENRARIKKEKSHKLRTQKRIHRLIGHLLAEWQLDACDEAQVDRLEALLEQFAHELTEDLRASSEKRQHRYTDHELRLLIGFVAHYWNNYSDFFIDDENILHYYQWEKSTLEQWKIIYRCGLQAAINDL